MFNRDTRRWINYYSHFYKSALYATFLGIDPSDGATQVQAYLVTTEWCLELAAGGDPNLAGPAYPLEALYRDGRTFGAV
jgi:hypothetical protein